MGGRQVSQQTSDKMKPKPRKAKASGSEPAIKCVDLFCGAGGLTLGLQDANIEVALGVDADRACRFPYEANTGVTFLRADVRELSPDTLKRVLDGDGLKMIAGCAPCQPFSTYTQGKLSETDERWGLLASFARLAKSVAPDFITMENVWKLQRHQVFEAFLTSLGDAGYQTQWWVLDCVKFGIPQTRRRLVLIASRHGVPLPPQPVSDNPDEWPTVRETIGGLKPLAAGGADPSDPIHVASRLSPTNLKRIKASKPGGTWKDWPEELRATCHTKTSGRSFPSVYGRMNWDAPSPTITGQCFGFGNGRFGHPEQHRALSLREAALLQTFPEGYKFAPEGSPIYMKQIGQMIGNAVPPKLGEAIGAAIMRHAAQLGSSRT
jgi:DNA (cytosine-5)-methyltransferase 1